MNLLHLKYAVEIARVGSLNRAAENLYMGQPNLSRAIRELETSLGITIFERSSAGMVPTDIGEAFLAYAKKILKDVNEVENLYHNGVGKQKKQQFSISVPRTSYISDAFSKFSKQLKECQAAEIFYRETNAMRAVKNILESDYRLGIIRYASIHDRYFREMLEEKGLHYETVTEFSYCLVLSKQHPLAQKTDIAFSDLRHYIEIAHADPYVPTLPASVVRKEELPEDVDRRIFVFERASQFELLCENTDTFMWVAPAPQELLDRYGLVQKQCTARQKRYRDVLIYRKDYQLTELDKAFITELTLAKRAYIHA